MTSDQTIENRQFLDQFGITSSSTADEVLEAQKRMHEIKRSNRLSRSRDQYVEGARFQVVSDIARLEGIVLFGKRGWAGWSRNLSRGEMVTFAGWQPGFNTPDALIATFHADRVPPNARLVSVWQLAGLFLPWPFPGLLEQLEV